ncbi:MAG TPA: hypothetical protein VFB60_26980 [Ktedonobacteraceae bacterium]|nr:hypothetical protein [Ktedonobacteraceae bacterium]
MQEEKGKEPRPAQSELSPVWQELLGGRVNNPATPGEMGIPVLESDPWRELLREHGVEIIDLQEMHLQISDQDVEEALQIMREQADGRQNGQDPPTRV